MKLIVPMAASIIALLVPSPALAVDARPVTTRTSDCVKHPKVAPRQHLQRFDSTDITGGLAGLPDRVYTDVQPGQKGRVCVGFHNRTGGALTLIFTAEDVGVARSGAPTTADGADANYGAASWLELPPTPKATLQHGDLIWLDVGIEVPIDTSGGSNYAAVVAAPAPREGASDSQVQIAPSIAVQLFLDVPGDLDRGGKIIDVRAPRIVWWDGFGIEEIPILKRLRGAGIAPIRFKWENTGSFTERVAGTVTLESTLGGRDVASLDVRELQVLRDSARPYEVTWSEDIPMIGRFTPTIVLDTGQGVKTTYELPAIWVIPAWWYLIALLGAIALPAWMRRRSKQRYAALVARVEAAEAGAVSADTWANADGWSDEQR